LFGRKYKQLKKEIEELKKELVIVEGLCEHLKDTQDQMRDALVQMGKIFKDIINKLEEETKDGTVH
jgi:predicted  nucleic acid-binding Zn-ribbon protein